MILQLKGFKLSRLDVEMLRSSRGIHVGGLQSTFLKHPKRSLSDGVGGLGSLDSRGGGGGGARHAARQDGLLLSSFRRLRAAR